MRVHFSYFAIIWVVTSERPLGSMLLIGVLPMGFHVIIWLIPLVVHVINWAATSARLCY